MPPSAFRDSLSAIGLACAGYFLFCVGDAILKALGDAYSSYQIISMTSLSSMALALLLIIVKHGWIGLITPKWKLFVIRGVQLSLSTFCVVLALNRIPLADFYGIIFLTPMVTTLFAAVFLKEPVGIYRILAIIIGFIGVLIITGPAFENGNVGYLYAGCCPIVGSIGAILVRKIGSDKIPLRFAFYPFAVATIIFTPLTFIDGINPDISMANIGIIILFAVSSVIGLVLYSLGFTRARDTALVAPFHYTQMIWGILLGMMFFSEIPTWTTLAGSALISMAGIVVIWREHVHHRQIATPTPENTV